MTHNAHKISKTKLRLAGWLLTIVALLALVAVFAQFWPIGADYYYHRYPAVRGWLAGESQLYDVSSPVYRVAPWALILLVPLVLLPLKVGQAVLIVLSLGAILLSFFFLKDGFPANFPFQVMAALNFHTFDVLIRGGKLDPLVLLGVALSWWAIQERRSLVLSLGLLLIATKPPNGLLVGLLFVYAIRSWPVSDLLKAFSLPLLAALASAIAIGPDWPLRYVRYQRTLPPNPHLSVALWRGASQLGLPRWPLAVLAVIAVAAFVVLAIRVGLTAWSVSIAITTSMVFAPYANDSHLVLLVPAFLFVASHDVKLAGLAYLTTFTPLLRVTYGYDAAPLDMLYPVVLLAGCWALGLRSGQRRMPASLPT